MPREVGSQRKVASLMHPLLTTLEYSTIVMLVHANHPRYTQTVYLDFFCLLALPLHPNYRISTSADSSISTALSPEMARRYQI